MKSCVIYIVLFVSFAIVKSSPIHPGHLNAVASDSGMSVISVEKDVILSPGKEGHNFNAKSDSQGHALVNVNGTVRGSAFNRAGQEFNAISKNNGTSQVRVNGDLLVEKVDPKAHKFDAISESGGESVVQVGNIQIISGAREGRLLDSKAEKGNVGSIKIKDAIVKLLEGHGQDGKPAVDLLVSKKNDTSSTKMGNRETLGASWGAAAVAEHNSRPWEELENDTVVEGGSVVAHVSDIFGDDPSTQNKPSGGLEIHDFPHGSAPENPIDVVHEPPKPDPERTTIVSILLPVSDEVVTTEAPSNLTIIENVSSLEGIGSLNAHSKGAGSKSVIKIKGSVQD